MKRTAPKPPTKVHGRQAYNPESKTSRRIASKTEDNLRNDAKDFRNRFISCYLSNGFRQAAAYVEAGGKSKTYRGIANAAYELMREPYVAQKIREAIDAAELKDIFNRNRIAAGLVREANYEGLGTTHAGRVSAWSKLATIAGMDAKKAEANLGSRGGILVVPATESVDNWEKRSAKAQAALKEAVRE